MKNFEGKAYTLVHDEEQKRIALTPAPEGWHREAIYNLRVFVITKAYILGYEKAYLSSNAEGAPIYEVTYDRGADRIYFVTYQQTDKKTIDLNEAVEGGNK